MSQSNGTSLPNFVSTRQDALHHLGTAIPDAVTAAEALKFARLSGWNVRKVQSYAHVAGQAIPIPDSFATVRDNPLHDNQVDVLGDVGKGYNVLQNEDQERLLDLLVEESGATYEAGGEFDGGRKAFVTLRLPGQAKVGPDRVDSFITAINTHDGKARSGMMVTPVRAASQTTLNLAYQKADYMFQVKHTSNAHKYLQQQAHEALEFAFNYYDNFQTDADKLVNTALTQSGFERLIEKGFGAPKGAAVHTITRTQNKLDHMAELFANLHNVPGVGSTAWAGLNALAEWHDHHSPVRVGGGSETDARSVKALLDPAFKNKALKLMLAVA